MKTENLYKSSNMFLVFITLLFSLILIANSTIQTIPNQNIVQYRHFSFKEKQNWNKSHEKEVTKNKISFKYSKDKGFYCKTKKNTFKHEFVFKIKQEYIICACMF